MAMEDIRTSRLVWEGRDRASKKTKQDHINGFSPLPGVRHELRSDTFYQKQAEAEQWLKSRPMPDYARKLIES